MSTYFEPFVWIVDTVEDVGLISLAVISTLLTAMSLWKRSTVRACLGCGS